MQNLSQYINSPDFSQFPSVEEILQDVDSLIPHYKMIYTENQMDFRILELMIDDFHSPRVLFEFIESEIFETGPYDDCYVRFGRDEFLAILRHIIINHYSPRIEADLLNTLLKFYEERRRPGLIRDSLCVEFNENLRFGFSEHGSVDLYLNFFIIGALLTFLGIEHPVEKIVQEDRGEFHLKKYSNNFSQGDEFAPERTRESNNLNELQSPNLIHSEVEDSEIEEMEQIEQIKMEEEVIVMEERYEALKNEYDNVVDVSQDKLEEYRAKLRELKDRECEEESFVAKAESELSEALHEVNLLQFENEEKETIIDEMEHAAQIDKKKIDDLLSKEINFSSNVVQLEEKTHENHLLEEQLEKLKLDNIGLEQQYTYVLNEAQLQHNMKKEVADLAGELAQTIQKHNAVVSTCEEVELQNTELEESLKKANAELGKFSEEREALRINTQELEGIADASSSQYQSLSQRFKALETDNQDLSNKCGMQQEELQRQKTEFEAELIDLRELKSKTLSDTRIIEQLQQQKQSLEEQLFKSQEDCEDFKSKFENVKHFESLAQARLEELDKLRADFRKLKEEFADTEDKTAQVESLTRLGERQKAKIQEMEQRFSQATSQLENQEQLFAQITQLQKAEASLQQRLEAVTRERDELLHSIEELRAAFNDIRSRADTVEAQNPEEEGELRVLREHNDMLNANLDKKEQEINMLQEKLREGTQQIDETLKQLEELKMFENEYSPERFELLNQELLEERETVQKAEEEKEELGELLDELKRDEKESLEKLEENEEGVNPDTRELESVIEQLSEENELLKKRVETSDETYHQEQIFH